MKTQLAIFDLAGTTIKDNHDVHKALRSALDEFEINATLEDINEVMGLPKPLAINLLLQKMGARRPSADLVSKIHQAFVTKMTKFYCSDPQFGETDGVSDTFGRLQNRGIKVMIDTGFDRGIADVIIERVGWKCNGLIYASVTSDEVENGRPHPDMIYRAMQIAGVTDSRLVAKVGDTVSDLVEGNSAGCGYVIGVTTGAFSRERLRNETHTHLIDSIPEILDII